MCGGAAAWIGHPAPTHPPTHLLLADLRPSHTLSDDIAQVHDVEDLARVGRRHGACPYYASRHLAVSADLVFCPYRRARDHFNRKNSLFSPHL